MIRLRHHTPRQDRLDTGLRLLDNANDNDALWDVLLIRHTWPILVLLERSQLDGALLVLLRYPILRLWEDLLRLHALAILHVRANASGNTNCTGTKRYVC